MFTTTESSPFTTGDLFTTTESSPFTTGDPFHLPSKKRITIGVTICICGNMLIVVALNIQKHAHNTIAGTGKAYLANITWWFGMVLLILGETGNFAAYGFAPASVVAPLGSTGIIFNAMIAVIFLKEKLRLRDVVGIIWAIVGAYLLVTYNNSREHMLTAIRIWHYLKKYTFMAFILVEVCIFILIVYLHHARDKSNVVTILLQVALLGSLTVISAKAVSSMLTLSFWGHNQVVYPIFYIMLAILILSGIGQIKYLNQAMASSDATVVMPINFVFFTLIAMLSGIVFYQEFWKLTVMQICMTILGAFLSFGGVYLISGGRESKAADKDKDGDEDVALLTNEHDSEADVPIDSKEDSESKLTSNTE